MDRNENLEYLRKAQTCIKLNKFISAIGQKNLQPYISRMLNNDVDVSVVSNETLDLIVANIKQELKELQ
mgnify:FL=1